MQWPFAAWGADAVLSGHAHAYERIERDGIVYFVNGLGGRSPLLLRSATGGQPGPLQRRLGSSEGDRQQTTRSSLSSGARPAS